MMLSNRKRLDSGVSNLSESSKGSGKPPRRRSHRPRGCRGGSNRRRGKAAFSGKQGETKKIYTDEGKVGAKKILPQNSEAVVYNQDRLFSSLSVFTEPTTDSSFSHPRDPHDVSFLQHFSSIQQSFSDSSSSEFGMSFPMGNNIHILPPLATNSYTYGSLLSGPNPYALKNAMNNYNAHVNLSQNHNYQPTSFAKYKDPGGYGTSLEPKIHLTYAGNLPTLPSTSNYSTLSQPVSESLGPPPPRRRSATTQSHKLSDPANKDAYIHYGAEQLDSVYRAERLEIQRQSVEGGSLFLTSPRSFLMGQRNSPPKAGISF